MKNVQTNRKTDEPNTTKLSKKAISDFKKVYFDEFGVELSDEGANKKGLELLTFIKLIYEPIPDEYNDATKRKHS